MKRNKEEKMKRKIIGIVIVMLLMITPLINARENPATPICDFNGDGVADLSDVVYQTQIMNWLYEGDLRADLNGDGVVNLSDVTLFASQIGEEGWCHATFWELLNPEEEPPVTVWTSGGGVKYKHDLDRHGSYKYFSHGKRAFVCGEEKYYFDWHIFWARVLDKDMNQVSSAKVHLLSNNIFNLGTCKISYEQSGRRDITLTKLEE